MKRAQSDVKLLYEERDAVVTDTERLRAFFNEHDTDKTGSLDKQQFGRLLASSGMTAQKASASVDQIFAVVDTDSDGSVSFSEWNAWQSARNRPRKSGQGQASADQSAMIADLRKQCAEQAVIIAEKDRQIKELEELVGRLRQPQEGTEGQVARLEAVWPGHGRSVFQWDADRVWEELSHMGPGAGARHALPPDVVRYLQYQTAATSETTTLKTTSEITPETTTNTATETMPEHVLWSGKCCPPPFGPSLH